MEGLQSPVEGLQSPVEGLQSPVERLSLYWRPPGYATTSHPSSSIYSPSDPGKVGYLMWVLLTIDQVDPPVRHIIKKGGGESRLRTSLYFSILLRTSKVQKFAGSPLHIIRPLFDLEAEPLI